MEKVKKGEPIRATGYNQIVQAINGLTGKDVSSSGTVNNKGGQKLGSRVFQFDVMQSDDIDTGISATIAGGQLILEKNIFDAEGKHRIESELVEIANADLSFKSEEELAIQWDGTTGTLINFQESEKDEGGNAKDKPIKLKIGKFSNTKLNGDVSNFLLYHSYTHSPKIQINPQVLSSEAFGIKNINWIVENGKITGVTAEVNEGKLIEQKHSNVEFYKYGESKPKPEGGNPDAGNPDDGKNKFPKLLCFFAPDIKKMETCMTNRAVPVQANYKITMNETQNNVDLSFDLEFENDDIKEIKCITDSNGTIPVSNLTFKPDKDGATATLVITQYISGNYHYVKPISVPAPILCVTCESQIKFITEVNNSQECGKTITFDNFGRLLAPYGKDESALKLDLRVSGLAPLEWNETDRSMKLNVDSCEKDLGMGGKIKLIVSGGEEAVGDKPAVPAKLSLCISKKIEPCGGGGGSADITAIKPLHSANNTLSLCLDPGRITTANNDKINLGIKGGKLALSIETGCAAKGGGIDTADYPLEINGSCIKLKYSTYCHLLPNGTGTIQLIKNDYNELDLNVVSLGAGGGIIDCIDMNTYSEALAFGDCMNVYSTMIYYKLTLCNGMLGMKISRECM